MITIISHLLQVFRSWVLIFIRLLHQTSKPLAIKKLKWVSLFDLCLINERLMLCNRLDSSALGLILHNSQADTVFKVRFNSEFKSRMRTKAIKTSFSSIFAPEAHTVVSIKTSSACNFCNALRSFVENFHQHSPHYLVRCKVYLTW